MSSPGGLETSEMTFWHADTIGSNLGGRWIVPPQASGSAAIEVRGVSTDSRSVTPGQAFVALRGEKLDGHDYLVQAASSGAAILIVDRPEKTSAACMPGGERPVAILHVPDTGIALIELAAAWRTELAHVPVIAVTGSNGKTTTTRLIETVLSANGPGTASIKSFNNRIGVPLTMLRARSTDTFLLCEVGTNAIGEIAELAPMLRPTITVITSIGREHLEGLGGLAGSAREAAQLLRHPWNETAIAIVPAGVAELDGELGDTPLGKAAGRIVRFGESAEGELRITEIRASEAGVRFCLAGSNWFEIPLIGHHNAINATAAIAVGRQMGMKDQVIAAALREARGAEMRLERRRIALSAGTPPIDVINDAYNANPESMLAAIATFKDLYGGQAARRRVAILGDMLELGEHGPDCHREIGDAIAGSGAVDLCILVGPLMMFAAERIRKVILTDRVIPLPALDEAAARSVAGMLHPGDAVLIKGSRGMGLERILRAVETA